MFQWNIVLLVAERVMSLLWESRMSLEPPHHKYQKKKKNLPDCLMAPRQDAVPLSLSKLREHSRNHNEQASRQFSDSDLVCHQICRSQDCLRNFLRIFPHRFLSFVKDLDIVRLVRILTHSSFWQESLLVSCTRQRESGRIHSLSPSLSVSVCLSVFFSWDWTQGLTHARQAL
jgi:hypothetical protein